MGAGSVITAWRASRRYGRVLHLRKRGHTADAFTAASDGLARVLNSGARPTPYLMTCALSLADMCRILAQELGRSSSVTTCLRQTIDYWEHAIREDPLLGEFQIARDYIALFRAHLGGLNSGSRTNDLK